MIAEPCPITYWERMATRRWGKYLSDVQKEAILQAHAMLEKPTRAIDVGTDGGRWSYLLSHLGWDMICTDVEPCTLEACRQRLPDAKCILVQPQDITLPCETGSLELVLCMEVDPVIDSDWFLAEAHRALSGGGVLVGRVLNKRSLRGLFVRAKERAMGHPSGHHYQRSYSQWRRRLGQLGFSVAYERGYCWFPFPRESDSRLVSVFGGLERWLGLRRLVSLSPWVVFVAQKTRL
jgi:SAM-dependent methyltransferase